MSEWQESANRRRDFRAGDRTEIEPHVPAKKGNRRRWCKGRIGQAHDYERVTVPWFGERAMKVVDRCKGCGRQEFRHLKTMELNNERVRREKAGI